MKQRITALQVQELDPDQQNRLRIRWTPQEGDYIAVGDREEMVYYLNGINRQKSLPLLSVGELMELLTQFGSDLRITYHVESWRVRLGEMEAAFPELRDALWELTKKVL